MQTNIALLDARTIADVDLPVWQAWLGAAEQERCQRFARPLRRRQFVLGRVLARLALGRVLNISPRAIAIEQQAGQAPLLASPVAPAAGFSISHSGHWVACAASASDRLGLDIECINAQRDLAALALHAFNADQMAHWRQLQGLPEVDRVAGFYRIWSEKEARFKLGPVAASHCAQLTHAELSIALCRARPWSEPPVLACITLP